MQTQDEKDKSSGSLTSSPEKDSASSGSGGSGSSQTSSAESTPSIVEPVQEDKIHLNLDETFLPKVDDMEKSKGEYENFKI